VVEAGAPSQVVLVGHDGEVEVGEELPPSVRQVLLGLEVLETLMVGH
jgi:hypothetical protein